MQTQAGDPGAFARFDLARVPSPCFVIDRAKVAANCDVLADVAARAGAKVLLALKAFALPAVADVVAARLDGCCASGLFEARLAREWFGGELSTFGPAYRDDELDELIALSDHLIFNTPEQMARLDARARAAGRCDLGLRVNPQTPFGEVPRYDPSSPGSRLGFPLDQLAAAVEAGALDGVAGVHVHNLCEQVLAPLAATWAAMDPVVAPLFGRLDWINLGGGHHITRADYDRPGLVTFLQEVAGRSSATIYIEPGEAVALDAGIVVGTVLERFSNGGVEVAVTDLSATCHLPDVVEAPYRPAMLGERADGQAVRLGGPSCLAGDVIGDYRLPSGGRIGERFALLDQAHYSFVKTNSFNGVPLPPIWLWDSDTDELGEVASFGYADFAGRLGTGAARRR